MSEVHTFWLEPTAFESVALRRYASGSGCPGQVGDYTYHNAVSDEEVVRLRTTDDEGGGLDASEDHDAQADHLNLRWPKVCASCAYEFTEGDRWQVFRNRLYCRPDTGDRMTISEAPPGAMWDAHWLKGFANESVDGRVLVVKLPNGREWVIDSTASNCDRKGEEHDCWCRHGNPPHLTVNKIPNPGRSTCGAGAGSVQAGDWHGFLRDGVLA